MKFHRFDAYKADKDEAAARKAKARVAYRKQNQGVAADTDKMKRIQEQRGRTMRAKRVPITLPTIGLALLALTFYPRPAEAHCYSRWYYPYPQHCGGIYNRVGVKHDLVYRQFVDPPLPPEPQHAEDAIPLPNMNATWGGAMDSELELQMQRQGALRKLSGE